MKESQKTPESKATQRRLIGTAIGIALTVLVIVILAHPEWLPLSAESVESMRTLEQNFFLIDGSLHITAVHILTVLLAGCVTWLVYMVLPLLLRLIGKKSGRTATITTLIANLLKYLAWIVGIVWGLSILGVNTMGVLAGVGIVGLALGFGAQSLIEDIITGFFIIFEGQYNIGDIIVLDDFRGVVQSIGVRTTVIEDAGGNLKVVNNSDIRNFQNRSRKNSLAIVLVDVAYETDLRALDKLLKEEIGKLYEPNKDLFLAAPEYYGVEELGASGVQLKFAVSTKETNVFAAKRRLTREIRILFADHNVEIPFPQVVVHQAD